MSCRTLLFICLSVLLSSLTGCAGMLQMATVREPRETSLGGIEWQPSFKEALKVARARNKPMMLVFYGVSSRRLDRHVFSDPDVVRLSREFVCLRIGAEQGDLTQRYDVQEFPTIVFTDPQGGEYDKSVGYRSRSSFVEVLRAALVPVEVEYSLRFEPSRQDVAVVECVFRNVRWRSLSLALLEKHDKIFNVTCRSPDDRPGCEEIEKGVWHVKFAAAGMKTVTMRYEVALNIRSRTSYQPEYVSYVGDDYGVLDGHTLFMMPQDLHTLGGVKVHLSLPADWRAITPWEATGRSSFVAGSLKEAVDSIFCVGQFQFAKRQLGEHEIYAVGCGIDENTAGLDRKADEIVRIFRDYVMRFGDFPFRRYLAVFAGPAADGAYIHGSAHGTGFVGPVNVDYTFMAHEIFHVWNGGMIAQKSDYEGWFKEGFTQYYGYLTPYRVGLYEEDRFFELLRNDYREYLRRYGTSDDMPLTRVKEALARKEGHDQPESARLWIMYNKGALVAFQMDSEIRKRTDGRKTLDDLMYHMFHEFRDREYSSEDILNALNTVTGQDFTKFFSDFVYGTAELPPIEHRSTRIAGDERQRW